MGELAIVKNENLGFVPEIVGYLASIKEFEYSYKYYNLRHPGGIFNLATSCVVNDFLELLTELEDHQNNYDKDKVNNLAEKFRILVLDFIRLYDSCAEIIIGCSKQHASPPKHYWDWLKKNGYSSGVEIFKRTKEDLDVFRKINNKLKHTSYLVQPINFYNKKSAIMGFYIEAFDHAGSLGPDEELHPRYNGQITGTSYNLILCVLYYNLYKLSDVLKDVVIDHFRDEYDIQLALNSSYSESNNNNWKELNKKMNELPRMYFPNEFDKKIYISKDMPNKLIFKEISANITDLNGWGINSYSRGDGFTRSFRMIFYRDPNSPPQF
jgi:hypothetical protein